MGQLKTSLSHLEYENAQLKRDVAKLQQENRAMEDRLVQEEQDNGDLTARLDDAGTCSAIGAWTRPRGPTPVATAAG